MDQEAVGNVVLLALVTLISVVQNGKGSPSLGRMGVLEVRGRPFCVHALHASAFTALYLSVHGWVLFCVSLGFPSLTRKVVTGVFAEGREQPERASEKLGPSVFLLESVYEGWKAKAWRECMGGLCSFGQWPE